MSQITIININFNDLGLFIGRKKIRYNSVLIACAVGQLGGCYGSLNSLPTYFK